MDRRKVALGALFLFVSSVTTIEAGLVGAETPVVATAVGALVLAAGSLLLGHSRGGSVRRRDATGETPRPPRRGR